MRIVVNPGAVKRERVARIELVRGLVARNRIVQVARGETEAAADVLVEPRINVEARAITFTVSILVITGDWSAEIRFVTQAEIPGEGERSEGFHFGFDGI